MWNLLRLGERKIAKMVAVYWLRCPPCPYMVKTFKNFFVQNQIFPAALSLHKSSGTGDLPKLLKWWSYVDVWPFYVKVKLVPHAFVWALYIYMGKILKIHILDISSIIQLNRSLIMSIRVLMRHKIAKCADRKSKMSTTAAVLKINFQHLFSNLRSLWAETCSLATGWLLDRNKRKLCRSKIKDGRNGSTPLNKMAAWAKNRKFSMAWFQTVCTEMFHQWPSTKITKMAPLGWTNWWPELKIEKPLKDISMFLFYYSPHDLLLHLALHENTAIALKVAKHNCHRHTVFGKVFKAIVTFICT